MPTIAHDGADLHYDVQGEGPVVVLQHPLTADGRAWGAIGVVADLVKAGYRCVIPDALGHGRSGPAGPERVGLWRRASDLLAVADAVGAERFHYIGYSMGGWIGTGLVNTRPDRLLSLAVTGWDPIDGARRFTALKDMAGRRAEFLTTIQALNARTPGRAGPDAERAAGYVETYERLFKDLPSITSLINLEFPLMLAIGRDDPYRDSVESAAEALDVAYLETPGDHVGAFLSPEYRAGLTAWMKKVADR